MKLPDFSLPMTGDATLSNADLIGSKTVLFLYPKADTSGCTTESISFSEHLGAFKAAGYQIFGLSKDSLAKQKKFKEKHSLSMDLISDVDGILVEALGSWVEKSMYGKTYMGIDRSTFLIDETGATIKEWRKVRVKDHVEAVLEAVT